MSSTAVSTSTVNKKWELAERLAGHNETPKEALTSIFTGVMQQLEKVANIKIENSIREKVWNIISKERLKNLKEVFLSEFCNTILGMFNDQEASEMLDEHKQKWLYRKIFKHPQTEYGF